MKKGRQSSPRARRRAQKRVLLLLGWYAPQTEACIVRHARDAGWSLEHHAVRTGLAGGARKLDGILCILGGWERRPELTGFVRQAGVPTVDMHADEAESVPAGRVLMDNVASGRLAADHFIERGFKDCLFLCRGLAEWSMRERQQGFNARLDEVGIRHTSLECSPNVAARDVVARRCAKSLEKHMAKIDSPLGVFAGSDEFAVIVLEVCEHLGIKVPEEIALLGCGDRPFLVDFASVPLSSVKEDEAGRADAAARLLDRLMAGEPIPPDPILIPPLGVTTRRSTDILAIADLRVATALSYIRQHYADPLVDSTNIAEACGVPARTLARLFHQHLGRSVAEERRHVQLHHARKLLSSTSLTSSEIAYRCGFTSLLHFRRNLKRETGTSPRQWRRSHAT